MGKSLLPRLLAWSILIFNTLAMPALGMSTTDLQQGEHTDELTSFDARSAQWLTGICYFKATMRQTCYSDGKTGVIKYRQELEVPAVLDHEHTEIVKVNNGQWFEIDYGRGITVYVGGDLLFTRYPSAEHNGPAMFKYRDDCKWSTRTSSGNPCGACEWSETESPTTCNKDNVNDWRHVSDLT